MDADRFDTLTRTLTLGAPSRRAVLPGAALADAASLLRSTEHSSGQTRHGNRSSYRTAEPYGVGIV
jgi:hypothetical protein